MTTCRNFPASSDTLLRFLEIFHHPATARARWEPDPEQKMLLEAFANGELPESRRGELIHLLSSHTPALEFLAALLKNKGTDCEEE